MQIIITGDLVLQAARMLKRKSTVHPIETLVCFDSDDKDILLIDKVLDETYLIEAYE